MVYRLIVLCLIILAFNSFSSFDIIRNFDMQSCLWILLYRCTAGLRRLNSHNFATIEVLLLLCLLQFVFLDALLS